MPRLLILGGTIEASSLAAALAGDARFETLLSFAGATRAPRPPPVAWRVGGFGGVAGLADFLRDVDLMVDATHPFAATIKRNAVEAARRAGVPLLAVQRPAWRAADGDQWTEAASMDDAAQALGDRPRRVWLTIGQKELAAFRTAPWHQYIVRSVDPPDAASLPPNATVISARGPFDIEAERGLMRHHRIELLVTKNSGGSATRPKLDAARSLGVEVVMVRRPPPQDGVQTVPDAASALRWLDRHASTVRGV